MTALAAAGVVVVAFLAWRAHAHKRRMRAARARLDGSYARAQERAARAAMAPHTGDVAASPVHPPTNGRP